jgi:Periplasmic component of the Tol biopolymer transport system
MRPKLLTLRNLILVLVAAVILVGFWRWIGSGGKIFGIGEVPSTAGKIVFVSDRAGDGKQGLYMMDASGTGEPVALTGDGAGNDAEPAWNREGAQIAFTSDRSGSVRQIYVVDAAPGSRVVNRTNTRSTKEAPAFGRNVLYFLDAGRITSIELNSPSTEAVFPTAMQKKDELANLFTAGGVVRFSVSEDGSRIAAAVKQEQGEALLLYFPRSRQVAYGGSARMIVPQETSEGLVVAYFGGGPSLMRDEQGAPQGPGPLLVFDPELSPKAPDLPFIPPSEENFLVQVNDQGEFTVLGELPTEVQPNGMAISKDGKIAVFTADEGKLQGVFLVGIGSPNGGPIATVPARSPSLSPDGSQVVFASEGDIFIAPTQPGATPVNLTQGKGSNSSPVWSPRQEAR